MKSPDWQAYHEFLREGLDLIANRAVNHGERVRLCDELRAVAVVVRALLDLADRTVNIAEPLWYVVETVNMALEPWSEHSYHSSSECALSCAADIVQQGAAHASRVKGWSDGDVIETFVIKPSRPV